MNTSSTLVDEMVNAVAARVIEALRTGDAPVAPEYLTAAQVAQITGFSPKALEALRHKRSGPPYLKVGKSVRYRAEDVRAWVEGAQ